MRLALALQLGDGGNQLPEERFGVLEVSHQPPILSLGVSLASGTVACFGVGCLFHFPWPR